MLQVGLMILRSICMKRPLINTALEKQLLYRRDPRHSINPSAFKISGSNSHPSSSTEILMSAISDEKNLNVATELLPFDYFTRKKVSPA
jgi:hypothetical protein